MKKLVAVAAGALAAVSTAVISAGPAHSDPDDVSGEPYGKAVALLKSQGYKAVFGGAVGSQVPQNACIVSSQKVLTNGRVQLMLNCTLAAQPEPEPGAPKIGSNGVTTVTATPVAPRPVPAPPPPPPPG